MRNAGSRRRAGWGGEEGSGGCAGEGRSRAGAAVGCGGGVRRGSGLRQRRARRARAGRREEEERVTVKVDDRHLEAVHGDGVRRADGDRVEQAEAAAARHRVEAVDARVVARRAHQAEGHRRRLGRLRSQRADGAVDGGDDGAGGARRRAPRARRDGRHAERLVLREDALDQHRREWAWLRVGARLIAIAHRVQRRDEPVRVATAERSLVGGREVGRELDAVHAARASEAHGAAVRGRGQGACIWRVLTERWPCGWR